MMIDLLGLPGGEFLSKDFCNWPVRIEQNWIDEPIAVVLLCGRLKHHEGDCDPAPPLSDVMYKEN